MSKAWFIVLCALFAWLVVGTGIGAVSDYWFIGRVAWFLLMVWVMIGAGLAMLQPERTP
jgi:hypothetical protein